MRITWYTLSPARKFMLSLLAFNTKTDSLSLASSGWRDCVYTKTVMPHCKDENNLKQKI